MVRNESRMVENVLQIPANEGSAGKVLRFAITIALLLGLLAGFSRPALADDATPIAVDSSASTIEATKPETPTATPTPTETAPTATPTDAAGEYNDGANAGANGSGNDGGTPTASETATETATPVPTPEPPVLNAVAAKNPACKPVKDSPETIASGAALDYDCAYQVKLTGERLAPAWIAIDWSVAAEITDGWSVQLLSSAPKAEWSKPGQSKATLQQTTGSSEDASPVVRDLLDRAATWTFRVRITRTACNLNPAELTLALNGVARLPGHDDAAVTNASARVETDTPFKIVPTLAPISEPRIDFNGPLSFGTIGVTAEGPTTPVAKGTVNVTISKLDLACGDWTVNLQGQDLSGSNGVEIPANTLTVTSVNGGPLDGGPCDLSRKCSVAVVHADPDAAANVTLTLGVSLALPDQPGVGSFDSTLSASVTRAQ
jgi:hypothetical protein